MIFIHLCMKPLNILIPVGLLLAFGLCPLFAQKADSLICPNPDIRDAYHSTHKRYHYYRVAHVLASRPGLSKEKAFEYLCKNAQFAAPFSEEIKGELLPCSVANVKIGPTKKNPILTCVDSANLRLINYSLPGHFLHPGKVVRRIVEENGEVIMVTESWGYGKMPRINERRAEKAWQKIDATLGDSLVQWHLGGEKVLDRD